MLPRERSLVGASRAAALTAAIALVLFALVPSSALSQTVSWTQRVVGGPPGMGNVALAHDSFRQVTVLFGGTTDGYNGNDQTWEWDVAAWNQRAVAGPSPRLLDALAYDSARHVV